MKRTLEQKLIQWKTDVSRRPLILRGARQVGKSYLIQQFGLNHFDHYVEVNLEFQPELINCFQSLDPFEIVEKLETYLNTSIHPGNTLLFIDEIQEYPKAIQSLRYFKEKMPELHVISAGSLLEFALEEESFSFPVGRVEFLQVNPLSFVEYLSALNQPKFLKQIETISLENPIDDGLHEHLMKSIRHYFLIGGMPDVINEYRKKNSILACRDIQSSLLSTYQKDFGKYATKVQVKHLQRFFSRAPGIIAQNFKYVNIDPETRSKDLRVALEQLCYAGLIRQVYATSASGLPLRAQINEKKFKLLFLDIGLVQAAVNLEPKIIWESDLDNILKGALAEQFVGQELIAYESKYEEKRLYFWEREKKPSSSEVDYVINIEGKIIPIEVKAGKTGRLKSIQQFMKEKKCSVGVRISPLPLHFERNILSVPFYLVSQLPRLLKSIVP